MPELLIETIIEWCWQNLYALLVALVGVPTLFAVMRKRVEADVNSLAGFMAGALVFHPLQFLRRFITLYVSFDYAKRQLELPATKYLPVPARDDVNLETDSIFVPLTLEQNGKPYDHSTVLRVGNRLRIVGDPGSGKTTILKRMLRDQCKRLARWRGAHQALFPVMIELRSLKPPTEAGADLGEWLLKVLEEKVKSFHGYEMGSRVDTFMTGQGLLVLFDGVDEIGTDQYKSVEMALNAVSERLAAKSANNVILMTMRAQFHLQVRRRFEQQYPAVLHVKPFSPSDIYALLNKWPFPASGAEQAARIYADLSDRPSLRELCTNPLVVSMYIADDQRRLRNTGGAIRNISVPDSRADFYKDVVEELLLKRREAQDGAQTQGRVRVRQQREQFFGSVAYHHLLDGTQPANVIPFADAIDIVKHVFEVDASDSDAAQVNAERILRSLSKDTGLFSEEKEGEQLRFIHLSFIEYFAALYAIEYVDNGWSFIVNRHADNITTKDPSLVTRLREVFPFAVRLCHFKDRAGHLADLCRVFSDELLQASCFLETKIYQSEPWLAFAAGLPGKLRALLPQLRRAEDAKRFYTIVAVLRDAEAHGCGTPLVTTDSLDEFFQELLASDRSVAFQAIQLMARFDAVAALRLAEMCGLDLLKNHPAFLIKNAEQPAFLGQILQRATSNRGDRHAWLVYAGLAGLFVPAARADLLAKRCDPALAAGDPRLVSFWTKIALREETLFAQVLANIDDRTRSYACSRQHIPSLLSG